MRGNRRWEGQHEVSLPTLEDMPCFRLTLVSVSEALEGRSGVAQSKCAWADVLLPAVFTDSTRVCGPVTGLLSKIDT